MATQADIPSDLPDDIITAIFQNLDAQLNPMIIFAQLHGMYTGILAVTLWNICEPGVSSLQHQSQTEMAVINKCCRIRRALVVVIILLHALITISFAAEWSYVHSAFVENGKSFWTVYLKLTSPAQAVSLEAGIAASMSTILADLYIIWCCWMVWGQRWVVVLLPILSLISATVLKILEVYYQYVNTHTEVFPTLYTSFVLATTLWCTLLIIYRILTVAGVKHGAGGQLGVYQRFIEVLVESSALCSISLIVFLALASHGDFGLYYLDTIASIAKGVAPTLLIGRAAAGHTRPNDEGNGSIVSSLHFQAPSEVGTTSTQESTTESAVLETDIEAQQQQSDELVVIVERA
ncbi:hypothetical protein ARMSODRAFT_1090596 [Armillaria solidipes]|uniref:Uncharacterized protein n=1 Tax=Armillaria solidipes TaxID=1076256 RepID=A0A2H3B7E3_9AGAR|nr:hypothetical protein ARMSODRAFT_1090596 [Armillaria solidipes]